MIMRRYNIEKAHFLPFGRLDEDSDSNYKSPPGSLEVNRIVSLGMQSVREVYPKAFDWLFDIRHDLYTKPWSGDGSCLWEPHGNGGTILIRMGLNLKSHAPGDLPHHIASDIKHRSTRLTAAFLHEVGECIQGIKGYRDRMGTMGIAQCTQYAAYGSEVFCEGFALTALAHSKLYGINRVSLPKEPSGLHDDIIRVMGLIGL
ncbi:hypothetical protein [Deinococcus yavapaiensis]|uniref:Uncharacterized protein n=1 Tax=Deinococcus yavapaiensis KR-236 TaxID=694435 RepID=A0A318S703_9DEIO|nr:hypothetical protein [Deinococcus yavapaiensis]PYE54091.1 hypothetical protein DES52_10653 [Deinococcus yavapaiensis KR-236]